MITKKQYITPQIKLAEYSRAILAAIEAEPRLAQVDVGYVDDPHYQTSYDNVCFKPSHDFLVGDKRAFHLYLDYTNGGTDRYLTTNVIHGSNGCSGYWNKRWLAALAVLYILIAAKAITKDCALLEAEKVNSLTKEAHDHIDLDEWANGEWSPIRKLAN